MTGEATREWLRAAALPLLLMALAGSAVGAVRSTLFSSVTQVKEKDDSYPLPPPAQLPVLSLGYRAAAADLLWSYVMVAQGQHLAQRRRFDNGARYFASIFELEPTYRRPYLLVDSILTFSAKKATPEIVREVRALLERGLKERPSDAQLFLQTGSFLAYIAPALLDENDGRQGPPLERSPEEEQRVKDEQNAWRLEGGRLLMRAAELGAADANLQWHAIAGAAVLNRQGERGAAIAFLERTYELTEDPELREEILRQLRGLRGEDAADRAKSAARRFESAWHGDLPFVSRHMLLLLGPRADAAGCAGPGQSERPECARDWRAWTSRVTGRPQQEKAP